MSLDKRYDFKKVENGRYEVWKNAGYFTAGDITKQKFSMVIPPPNVTGKLHIGHSIDTTIQDITCRYKKAKGFDVLYLPGCDHAGIATQAKVDAKLKDRGVSRFDIGREAFLKEAFSWKNEYSNIIHEQWAKMGLMLDYSRERFTLDEGFQKAVYTVFKTLYDKGLIYRGERIVNYDVKMRTALSNIEVIYKEDKGYFYYFKYRLQDDQDTFLTVATTRPETMFGDTCLVVNPKDARFQKYIGKNVINPANGDIIPVIADEYVDIDFGTGVMKCTPAHDPNDFLIGKKYHQKNIIIMNVDGTMAANTGKYAGMDRFDCREKLVKDIESAGNLIKIEEISHQVGHSERTDTVVEPILSKQWFVKMQPLAESLLKNQEINDKKVNFFPKRFEKVLKQWMSNCDDWCISRQLWWGHRIPVYYSKIDGSLIVSDHAPENKNYYYQDEDVLDTWFSSALWPFATLGWPENTKDFNRYYPLDALGTGYDIIFFWVARMYFQGLEFTKEAPFKDVIIHGLVRDKLGRKMSKSLGNGVDPIDIIDKYGVDSLRYFLATTASPGQDMRFDEEKVIAASNYLNKIWNSARFILMNIKGGYSYDKIDVKKLNLIDKYILSSLQDCIKKITKAMDKYEYGIASDILYNFVYDDFCSFYIEMCKISLNNEKTYENTIAVLLYVLKSIVMMIYPFSPFITEEIYLNLPQHLDSIMLESYPKYNKKYAFKNTNEDIDTLKKIISTVRTYKVENKLAPNASLDLIITGDAFNKELEPYVLRFTFAKSLSYILENKNTTNYILNNINLYIVSNINKEELLATLEKQKADILSELDRSKKILSNSKFIEKAPKEKVELEKEKFAKYQKQFDEIQLKIKNL